MKAKKLLAEVGALIGHPFYITVINRLYYSCFHATKALLLTKDLIPECHSGVVSYLNQLFVRDGNFDFKQASFFSRLMQERIEDDYKDFMVIDGTAVYEYVSLGNQYIDYVEEKILDVLS